ncbi:MAG: hypothetical protein LWY06_02280, partial [Firmicutes bacterium]|nr:hypothetical protein [Bacillota bacterium]
GICSSINSENGKFRLYSTADTVEFIRLVTEISLNKTTKVKINGKETELKGIIATNSKVESIDGPVIVSISGQKEIDITQLNPNISVYTRIKSKNIRIGERITLMIEVEDKFICPVCRVILPGNLTISRHGANIQKMDFPIKTKRFGKFTLDLEILAIRRGKGKLKIIVTDMYDSNIFGLSNDIIIFSE